ncbi:2-amino-4-hydroxy-6-hydroxymethyldihydropteridine diphosphokinase [Shewanella sp. 1_MG-2023]|uniref:2-amino-4-hydroxy-6- hydroxymethyldihydropteridine diphosphokinase n=1 Tax=unclassified Shewanella TaxID=196818 RepID=UPI0026E28AF5|nr:MULTISPECIES: 2-amino-4-hydroxy-6-hydroxymethyldihydropteridine diphosphokinase [unclassified Shewanella]MDO6611580.1 2-amino-4-hydroxy-6-hydroxymethyldihydropteridine diphosphokinase [Shewanella sp. 7_MG-2023]MDO6771435.1 2-amino-4-hydroxy-6-hydroxymethyldihydropteridine diphosphokinase [Shewanella sp. 2_MG-2023]MDO6793661.1 2-amino-4-hydroxy-6-hydroxymethyldihydropteridine diphosphokinase [Shewanella sp. 1_MG-2023]
MSTTVYVALGANLNEPVQQIQDAVLALKKIALDAIVNVSPLYRSVPMGDVEQPDYVNGVAQFNTDLAPIALLDALQAIENTQGRVREIRWGPRTLDLDILLYGTQIIDEPRLSIPHYGMKQRSFVLIPLADINQQLILPCSTELKSLITREMRAELIQI